MSDLSKQLRTALTDAGVFEQDPVVEGFNHTWNQATILEAGEEEEEKKKKARRSKTSQMLENFKNRYDKYVKRLLQAGRLEDFMSALRYESRGKKWPKGQGAGDVTQMRMAARKLTAMIQAVIEDEEPEDVAAKHVKKLVQSEDSKYREEFERAILDKSRNDLHPDIERVIDNVGTDVGNDLASAVQSYLSDDDEDIPSRRTAHKEREETLGAKAARVDEKLRQLGDMPADRGRAGTVDDDLDDLSSELGSTSDESGISSTPDNEAYDVQVIQKMGDRVLARIKGVKGGKPLYRYLTVASNELQRVTGNPDLRPGNIHDYIHDRDKTYKTKLKELEENQDRDGIQKLKMKHHGVMNNDPAKAYSRLRENQQKPNRFEDWLKQQTGRSAKEGLLNAVHRAAQKGESKSNVLELAMAMNEQQVQQLLKWAKDPSGTPYAKKFTNKEIQSPGKEKIIDYLDELRSEFGPTAESEKPKAALTEAFGDTIRRLSRALKRKLTPDDIRYAKRLFLYDFAAAMLAQQPKPVIQMMQKAGNSKFIKMKPVSATPTWDPSGEITVNQIQGLYDTFSKYDTANYKARVDELIDQVTGNDPKHPARRLLVHIANKKPVETILKTVNTYPNYNKAFQSLEKAYSRLDPQKDQSIKDPPADTPKINTERFKGFFDKIAPVLAEPKYVAELEKYAQIYEKKGLSNAVNVLKAIVARDVKSLALASQDPKLNKTFEMLQKSVILPIYLRWADQLGNKEMEENFSKYYAKAILESPEIAEARMDAHDLASAGVDLYVQRCNQLGRSKIDRMYDSELDVVFQDLLENAHRRFEEYRGLIESKVDYLRTDSFSDLVAIMNLTEDPISRINYIREYVEDPLMVTESHRNSLITPPKKSKYSPISNII